MVLTCAYGLDGGGGVGLSADAGGFGLARPGAFDVSCRGPFGELAGVVGIFHFHQAGKLANDFDAARERIVEFRVGGDVIAH